MKKGLSDVVTTVIIILLVIAALAIIWGFVSPTLRDAGSSINTERFTTNLEIDRDSIVYSPGADSISFVVERKAGDGEIAGFVIIVEYSDGQTETIYYNDSDDVLVELQRKSITIDNLNNGVSVVSLSVAPIILSSTGQTSFGDPIKQVIGSGTSTGSGGNPVCGNNVVESGEQCDDGNTANGDGCSSSCQTETSSLSLSIQSPGSGQNLYLSYFSHLYNLTTTVSGSPTSCKYSLNGAANVTIPGCSSFALINLTTVGSQNLVVYASNSQTTASSSVTFKTVSCSGDATRDGFVNFNDLSYVTDGTVFNNVSCNSAPYGTQCYWADVTGDGSVGFADQQRVSGSPHYNTAIQCS